MFDVWEIIAPRVERELEFLDKTALDGVPDLDVSQNEDLGIDSNERSYRKEVRSAEISLEDLRVILMAILKYNDGNTFADTEQAPLPQSEGEIGFRDEKTGFLILRYDELTKM
jgi:hypothetical protein